MGTAMSETVIRDMAAIRVKVVERLPEACKGGVSYPDADGNIWILLEADTVTVADHAAPIDLAAWVDVGYAVHAAGEPVTVADQMRRFDATHCAALSAFWSVAWEWMGRSCGEAESA